MEHPSSAMTSHADIAPDIVRRINEAADQLYEEAGRNAFPNVDAVRRRARANMNHVSLVMRDWRHQRMVPSAVQEDALPASLEPAGRQLLHAFWREASAIANGHLQAAQTGWEQERGELEEFRDQLAAAFDTQAGELTAACQASSALRAEIGKQEEQLAVLKQRVNDAETHAGNARAALEYSQAQLRELHESLRQAQLAQQQLAQQLQDQHAAAVVAAERNLSEQTRYAEQLGQARQEVAGLRAQLAAALTSKNGLLTSGAEAKSNSKPRKENRS
ncbi:DNA-binding protein [Duganella sp. HH105]|uniref:DNA-binding protein n=1 Tax=Duganella sp. HH105 TaxID=1781067 RepID=UPI000A00F908|nr:DNA-binding protein [Duganella sp. HH105]